MSRRLKIRTSQSTNSAFSELESLLGELKSKLDSPTKALKVMKAVQAAKSKNLTEVKLTNLINSTKGRFFTVEFIKKDGSHRVMNCQTLNPKLSKPVTNGLMLVRDAQLHNKGKGSIRTINLSTIKSIKINGSTLVKGSDF